MAAARAGDVDAGSFRGSAACTPAAVDKTIDAASKYPRRRCRAAKFNVTASAPATIAAYLDRRYAQAQADVRPDAAVRLDVAVRPDAAAHRDAAARQDADYG